MSRTSIRLNKSSIRPAFPIAAGSRKSPTRLFAILSLLILAAAFSLDASAQTTFESPAFTTGTVHNQNGWQSLGGAGLGCAMYDHLISTNNGLAPVSFGAQSLRISNSVTSGCFHDGTFSASLPNEAGEASAVNGGQSGGIRQNHFEYEFSIASAVPGAQQPGLLMSVAPDRGDGARMSYLRFEDQADGIHVFFDGFIDAAPFGGAVGDANGCGVEDDFTDIDIVTLSRTAPHTIKFVMDFYDGARNDVVKIYINGVLETTGTSWEDYFRYCEGQQTRTVDSMLFRTGGPAVPANAGNGFLIDSPSAVSSSMYVVDDDGTGSATDCNDSTPAYSTIQDAVAAALPGTTIQVCGGAYNSGSGIAVNKSLTLRGPNSGVSPNGGVRNPEATISGTGIMLRFSAGPSTVEGFKFDSGGGAGDGIIDAYDPALNLTIQKNMFVGGAGRFFFNAPSLLTFNDNYLTGTQDVGEGLFIAGNWNGTTGTAVSITNNVWENHLTAAMNLSSISGNISGNRITNVVYYGILLANSSGSLSINNNTFDAIVNPDLSVPNWGAGIRFYTPSFIGAVNIKSNTFKNSYTGVGVRQSGGNIAGMDIHVNFNTFINNANGGIRHDGTGALDAENNWWGCNYGPGTGGAGCAGTPNGVGGPSAASVDANPWLTLTTSAVPTTIGSGGTSTVTSKLTINSASIDTSASGSVPNTTAANFVGTNGTVAPPTSTTTAGAASTVFTSTSNAPANVATTVNSQTVNAPISINTPCVAVSTPSSTRLRNAAFSVPVTTGDITGRGVISYDFTVTYNPAVLSYTGYGTTGTISNAAGTVVTVNSNTPGTLIISGFNPNGFTGFGSLLDLNFTSIGVIGSSTPVTLSGFSYNEDNPCTGTTSGTVTIISGTISGTVTYLNSPSSSRPVGSLGALLTAAGITTVSTTSAANGTYSLSGLGNSNYTVTPSKSGDLAPGGISAITGFDASRIAQHVVNINPFTTPGQLGSADVSGNGTITSFDASMVAQFVVSIPNPGSAGTWRFIPVSRSYTLAQVQTGMSGQDYSAILMGDVTGNWNQVADSRPAPAEEVREEDKISVNAPSMSVASGDAIVIPVTLQNLNRKDIVSYQFEMGFERKAIQPTANPCNVLGTVSKDLTVTCNGETPGVLKVVVFGIDSITTNGVLLNLRFTAVGSAGYVTPLTFKGLLLNEGEPLSRATDGEIRIIDPTDDSDSIRGQLLSATGKNIAGVQVLLTASNGETRSVYSNELGYYSFDKVTVGETYVISVVSNRHNFTPQSVSAAKGMTQLDLIDGQ